MLFNLTKCFSWSASVLLYNCRYAYCFSAFAVCARQLFWIDALGMRREEIAQMDSSLFGSASAPFCPGCCAISVCQARAEALLYWGCPMSECVWKSDEGLTSLKHKHIHAGPKERRAICKQQNRQGCVDTKSYSVLDAHTHSIDCCCSAFDLHE